MERLTGNDALGLMEAYSAVHQPTINEEQIWEEVETWVNGLVEEGYDLSDYTWEDMYEAYLSEGPTARNYGDPVAAEWNAAMSRFQTATSRGLRAVAPGIPQGYNYNKDAGTITRGGGNITPGRSTTLSVLNQPGVQSRFIQNGRTSTAGRPSVTSGASQRQPGIPASPPAPRSTTTSARPPAALGPTGIPASPPAPRQTAAAGRPPTALGPTGMPLVGGIERRTPTSAELRAAQQARAGASRVSTAFAPSTGSLVSTPSVTPPSTTSVSPSVTGTAFAPSTSNLASRAQQARKPFIPSRAPLMQSFDPFDIVMGHLIDEGYAETEEDAAVIMANMSEEWKESIVEAYVPWDAPRYVWDKGVQVLTGRPSPRDVTAARQTQQTPERAKQLARVQANMRYGMQQVYKRTGDDPAKEGTAPLTPRHIRSAQTVGGTAGGKMYPGPQGKPQPSGIPSIKVPSTPELRRQNTAAQLRQALRTGRGMSGSVPNVGTPSGMPTPSGATGPYYPGSAPGYGIGQTKLAN